MPHLRDYGTYAQTDGWEQETNHRRKLAESKTVINHQASILDENRIVLYKKGKQMGTGYYIVEISSSISHVFITAFNVEKPQSLVMQIAERQARSVLELFDHDFETLASWLAVE